LHTPPYMIVPFIVVLCFLGAAASDAGFVMAGVVLTFGLVGLLMRRYHYSPAAAMIGFVLGPVIEKNLYLTINLQGAGAFTGPLTDVLMLIVILLIIWPAVVPARQLLKARRPRDLGVQ